MSSTSQPILNSRQMLDPFGVYCVLEGRKTFSALQRLNGKEALRWA